MEEDLPIDEEFTFVAKTQTEWGMLALLAFFLGGIGAGLFLVSSVLTLTAGMIAGLIIVAVGKNFVHLMELGRPNRFIMALRRPGKSWISRGLIITVSFIVLGVLQVAPSLAGFGWLPWTVVSSPGRAIQILAMLASFSVMIYVGFVLSSVPSIPFWNTTLLPLLFVLFSLAGGTALILIMLPFVSTGAVDVRLVQVVEEALVMAALVFVAVFLVNVSYSSVSARQSLRLIVRGALSLPFLVGVVLVGLVIPLLAFLYFYLSSVEAVAAVVPLSVIGVLVLVGGFFFNYTFVKAGVYVPQM